MNKIRCGFVLFLLFTKKLRGDDQCGVPIGSVIDGKIVGGYDLGYFKYPWFVSLLEDGEPSCGGTLVSKKIVVTAAHCFDSYLRPQRDRSITLEKAFEYKLGVYNNCMPHEKSQQSFKATKVYVHEKYFEKDPYYDIAAVKLNREASDFQPCCLPSKVMKESRRPKEALVTGLGELKFNSRDTPCTVHEARVLMYPDKTCRSMLNQADGTGKKLKGAFCAGYLSGGIDSCRGDSGGPLIALGPNSRYYLIGITSFGFDCAQPKRLGIYTDVSKYLGWLRAIIDERPGPSTPRPSGTDWSKYPATPWIPLPITFPPWQTLPPDYDKEPIDENPNKPASSEHHNRPVVIIINKKKLNSTKHGRHKEIKHKDP
nr:cationic trypsin-like [Onthophagus taurus]